MHSDHMEKGMHVRRGGRVGTVEALYEGPLAGLTKKVRGAKKTAVLGKK